MINIQTHFNKPISHDFMQVLTVSEILLCCGIEHPNYEQHEMAIDWLEQHNYVKMFGRKNKIGYFVTIHTGDREILGKYATTGNTLVTQCGNDLIKLKGVKQAESIDELLTLYFKQVLSSDTKVLRPTDILLAAGVYNPKHGQLNKTTEWLIHHGYEKVKRGYLIPANIKKIEPMPIDELLNIHFSKQVLSVDMQIHTVTNILKSAGINNPNQGQLNKAGLWLRQHGYRKARNRVSSTG